MRSLKLRGTTNGTGLAAAYNEQVKPETMHELNDPFAVEWTDTSGNEPFFVGETAMRIVDPEKAGYALRWPIKRGRLNKEGYRSIRELTGDVQDIWTTVLRDELEIDPKQFSVKVPKPWLLKSGANSHGFVSRRIRLSSLYQICTTTNMCAS
jgi:actin-related protein 8